MKSSAGKNGKSFFLFSKRAIDLIFALFIAFLLWWAMIVIWLLIRADSPGPGIFSQRRVGVNGRIFTCHKFRTMKVGTAQAVTNLIDPNSVTRLGAFLRRTKLDELPQIWNILHNEMSLVGPRPSLPTQTELIEARRERGVLDLKPGITGLSQINGIDMRNPKRLALWDARYLKLQSLSLDLCIILKTAMGSGQGDNVRRN